MLCLQVSDISKNYGTTSILSNITFQLDERERIGLVGVNGAGKSTLLQIIAGELSYDSGDIHKSKDTTIGYLAQNSGLISDHTIGHEMLAVFSHLVETEQELRKLEQDMADPAVIDDPKRYQSTLERYANQSEWFRDQGGFEMETKIRAILHGMGFGSFPQNTPIKALSGGQKTRLALAKMLLQEPDLLLLDEPTNHLDIPTLTWLESYLRGYPGAIIVVSHDRFFLDAIVDAIIEIERNSAKRYTGNYTRFIDLKAAEFASQMKQYEKQQDEIARMEDFVRKNITRASTTKRAQSRRNALERMDRMDKPMGDLKRASFRFEIERQTGKEVLNAYDISYAFEDGKPLFRPITIQMRRGDSMALIGPNGTGKTTLLRTLVGDLTPLSGTIDWGSNVRFGYYDQEQSGLTPSNTILDEVWNEFPHFEEARIRTVLGNFLFSGEDVKKRISALSGGEKARVSLTKLMLLQANVLFLDEPTNHLDLYSKEVLESALLDYEGTLLFISHDRYFLNKIAERVMELSANGVEYFLGNYDDYLEKKQEIVEAEQEAANNRLNQANSGGRSQFSSSAGASATKSVNTDYEADKQAKRDERMKQRRLEQLEQQIAEQEQAASDLEARMADPVVNQDYLLLKELQTELDSIRQQLQDSYAQWETLAD